MRSTCCTRVTSSPACGQASPASRPARNGTGPKPRRLAGAAHGRVGQAGDVTAAAVFYASEQTEFITGTTLLVDGGMTAGDRQRVAFRRHGDGWLGFCPIVIEMAVPPLTVLPAAGFGLITVPMLLHRLSTAVLTVPSTRLAACRSWPA